MQPAEPDGLHQLPLEAARRDAHRMVDQYVADHPRLRQACLHDPAARYQMDMLRGLLGLTAQALHVYGIDWEAGRRVLRHVLHGGAPTDKQLADAQQRALTAQRELAEASVRLVLTCPCVNGGTCAEHPDGLPGVAALRRRERGA